MSIFLLVFPFYEVQIDELVSRCCLYYDVKASYEISYFLGERNGGIRRRALYGRKKEEEKE